LADAAGSFVTLPFATERHVGRRLDHVGSVSLESGKRERSSRLLRRTPPPSQLLWIKLTRNAYQPQFFHNPRDSASENFCGTVSDNLNRLDAIVNNFVKLFSESRKNGLNPIYHANKNYV
jgi:hypothetical protein